MSWCGVLRSQIPFNLVNQVDENERRSVVPMDVVDWSDLLHDMLQSNWSVISDHRFNLHVLTHSSYADCSEEAEHHTSTLYNFNHKAMISLIPAMAAKLLLKVRILPQHFMSLIKLPLAFE